MSLMSNLPWANPESMATRSHIAPDVARYLCSMPGNSIGSAFCLTTFGESHGAAMGGVLDSVPAGIVLDFSRIQANWTGASRAIKLTTQRKESDTVTFLSGLLDGKTTGTPIGFTVPNDDARSGDYDHLRDRYRPNHADFTYDAKYGFRDVRGGGRASAGNRVPRVVAGAIARQMLEQMLPEAMPAVGAYVERVQDIAMATPPSFHAPEAVDATPVRCPDPETAERMMQRIDAVRKDERTPSAAQWPWSPPASCRVGRTRLRQTPC